MFGHKLERGQFFQKLFFSIRFYTENRCSNENVEIYRGGESSIGLTSKALCSSCE